MNRPSVNATKPEQLSSLLLLGFQVEDGLDAQSRTASLHLTRGAEEKEKFFDKEMGKK